MQLKLAPSITGFDNANYFQQKIRQFEEEYDPASAAQLIAELENRFQPEHIVTMDEIANDYPQYSTLLVQNAPLGEFAKGYAPRLQPFLQAPFPLANGDVVQGPWIGKYKIEHFNRCGVTADTLAGKRVLDIGANAGFDTFYLSTLGPSEIVGIEPIPLFYYQALMLWAMYNCPNLSFRKTRWQDARTTGLGQFDVVNCQGVLYHEPNPMQLIDELFELLAPGGLLVIETHISMGDDKIARFVEGSFWGDLSWFWLPTIPALKAMLRARGFDDFEVRDSYAVASQNPSDPERTTEGEPVGGRAFVTAVKPIGRIHAPKYGLA